MSILITGGAGYIGSHTTVELLNAGFDVVLVDDFSNSSPAVLERLEKITGKKFVSIGSERVPTVEMIRVDVANA